MEEEAQQEQDNLWLVEVWMEHRPRLQRILKARIPSLMSGRLDVDDLMQECYMACGRRIAFLQAKPEIPIFVKLRYVCLQTLIDVERHHIGANKRDARKECVIGDEGGDESGNQHAWLHLADSMASPRTQLVKMERQRMTRQIMSELTEKDKEILELRHFEDLSNLECAAVLEIEPKAASIRYVRALKRFQELVSKYTFYRN